MIAFVPRPHSEIPMYQICCPSLLEAVSALWCRTAPRVPNNKFCMSRCCHKNNYLFTICQKYRSFNDHMLFLNMGYLLVNKMCDGGCSEWFCTSCMLRGSILMRGSSRSFPCAQRPPFHQM